ncbi:NOP5/NOP56 family protein [Methanogenium sp. MK-MG]|uniref:NOP5/NOP56 family protein n=1 Tax=Methanogenium sp. MK-MG TaxID=2599926 RepID=UPI0013EBDAC7|nr:RNA-processing protein [Methanogenium sp. MK-MG]KAF1074499.1 putative NOP5 family protein [Methanogenium sp. MK-MG]
MRSYWFGDIDNGVCTPAQGDEDRVLERCDTIRVKVDTGFVPVSVDEACDCGFFADREEYLARLRSVTIRDARRKIVAAFSEGDAELIQMVRMLDEIDEVVNLLTEKAVEWYLVRNPGFSRKYKSMSAKRMVGVMKKERGPLGRICAEIDGLSDQRSSLMQDVSKRTDAVMPNCSALVGGLVAARLMERAGGLSVLAGLPASTIQVLGAEGALFSHLRSGSPPPKHGIIFQHRRVHNAPRNVRGKVSRAVAGKLAIAAKIDYYRGELDPAFIERAQDRIDVVGEKE